MVTEVVFEKDTKLSEVIKTSGSQMGNHYFLPFYFSIMSDGQIICTHIDAMPEDLKYFLLPKSLKNDLENVGSGFCDKLCLETYRVIKEEFPDIKDLTVDMDDYFNLVVIFDETEITQEQVNNFLQEKRNLAIKNKAIKNETEKQK